MLLIARAGPTIIFKLKQIVIKVQIFYYREIMYEIPWSTRDILDHGLKYMNFITKYNESLHELYFWN